MLVPEINRNHIFLEWFCDVSKSEGEKKMETDDENETMGNLKNCFNMEMAK